MEQLSKPVQSPLSGLREVENASQLEYILKNAKYVIETRDNLYEVISMTDNSNMTLSNKKNVLNSTKSYSKFFVVVGALVIIFGLCLCAIMISSSPHNTGLLFFGLVPMGVGAICVLISMYKLDKSKCEIQEIESEIENAPQTKQHLLDEAKEKCEKIKDVVWCAEIIPVNYRNFHAIDIMYTAVHDLRADTWKECTKIYDEKCAEEAQQAYREMSLSIQESSLRYNEKILDESRRAANNAGWAAAGAWAGVMQGLFR
jgi:hypothetical protein